MQSAEVNAAPLARKMYTCVGNRCALPTCIDVYTRESAKFGLLNLYLCFGTELSDACTRVERHTHTHTTITDG